MNKFVVLKEEPTTDTYKAISSGYKTLEEAKDWLASGAVQESGQYFIAEVSHCLTLPEHKVDLQAMKATVDAPIPTTEWVEENKPTKLVLSEPRKDFIW